MFRNGSDDYNHVMLALSLRGNITETRKKLHTNRHMCKKLNIFKMLIIKGIWFGHSSDLC